MHITTLVLGYLKTNCYILTINNKALIIDPADDANTILSHLENLEVEGILLTHHHFDHIGALNDLKSKFNLEENDFSKIKSFHFQIISTPGHTSDSITFYFPDDKLLFTGDFLFYHSIGRTDLPTGDYQSMIKSLELIKTLPNDLKVFPGHGISTILQEEKTLFNNYF